MLIGFGGPEGPEEVRPFLESVLQGVRIPQERFEEVLSHYEVIGGVSPYNAVTYKQREALQEELRRRGLNVGVAVGFRHSTPSYTSVISALKREGIGKVIGFVLAPLRSYSSFEKYIERIEEAKKQSGAEDIEFIYTETYYDHPLLIDAQAEQALKVISQIDSAGIDKTYFLFSAHSIPCVMARESGYDNQYRINAALTAQKLGLAQWSLAYQSRSGSPSDPWLEPDTESVIRGIDRKRFKNVMIIPIGFLCDNVEVIYDLDTECRKLCEELELRYFRAKTVADHPMFIRLIADIVGSRISACHSREGGNL